MTPILMKTIGDPKWLDENRGALLMLFPETFTHPGNINFLAMRYRLKLIGVDYKTDTEFAQCLVQLEHNKILLRDGICLRRGKA